jgi:hypothetical protein
MAERQPKGAMHEPAVVGAAVIFEPRRMGRIGVKVASRDLVVLSADHAAKAGEDAFGLIGARAVVRERAGRMAERSVRAQNGLIGKKRR